MTIFGTPYPMWDKSENFTGTPSPLREKIELDRDQFGFDFSAETWPVWLAPTAYVRMSRTPPPPCEKKWEFLEDPPTPMPSHVIKERPLFKPKMPKVDCAAGIYVDTCIYSKISMQLFSVNEIIL